MQEIKIDPTLDLVLERTIAVPRELVWRLWTEPEHVKVWFTPAPWKTIDCAIDLRPGGAFHTVMQSPAGENFPSDGCYLEIVPQRRLVFTDALQPGFRPSASPFFTAMIELEDAPNGTRYRAIAFHRDPEGKTQHEEMGFLSGWGTALDQLVTYAQTFQA